MFIFVIVNFWIVMIEFLEATRKLVQHCPSFGYYCISYTINDISHMSITYKQQSTQI